MQLKNAPNDLQSMAQDGDAILRSLQNKSLPIVDLMIRESLQNSLDATLPNAENTILDFNVGRFNSYELSSHLEGIENVLNNRYEMIEDFISISDKNTTGLTGDYSSTDAFELNKSNFYKLVFGIGKNQEADGAGGSWGLGKTSYFRIGAGIVIYYTRVKNGDSYEERLVASLIESPKEQSRLLPDNVRGIAWWGKYAENPGDDRIFPLTDKNEIYNILKIFNLTNYKDEETGTTIIIPYVKGTQNNIENENLYPWEENKELAIKYAIQRWYNPRLNNQEYNKELGNSKLITRVNDDPLIDEYNIEPFFNIMKDLYTSALTKKPLEKSINLKPIYLKRNGMKNPSEVPVGHVAFKKATKEELEMVAPNNRFSPLQLLGYKNDKKIEDNNSKIIAYCRKPGMIVEYSVDGEWTPKANVLNKNNLLIGFFVPNSNGELTTKFENEGYKNLEQYLRATENADHANWIDEDGFGIIQRMKSTTSKVINDFYQGEDSDKQSSATSGISRKFGKIFLPPKNYGRTSAKKKEPSTRAIKSENKNRMADINVIKSEPIDESNVKVDFKVHIKNGAIGAVYLEILSQEKKMNKKDWEKFMGSSIAFPFIISEIIIKKINNQAYYKNYNQVDITDVSIYQLEHNLDEFIIENKSGELIEIEGEMNIKTNTFNFIPNIAISSEKYKENGDV